MPESESLEFIPLHFGDKLRIVNPKGRLGILTLWSKTDYVEGKLREAGVDLDPEHQCCGATANRTDQEGKSKPSPTSFKSNVQGSSC
jgi:hypothetical protein